MVEAYIGKTVVVAILHACLYKSHLVGKSQEIIEGAGLANGVYDQRATSVLQFIGGCTRLRHADCRARYHDVLEISYRDIRY